MTKHADRTLSKSRILAWRQCPRRLWLEIHHPELAATGPAAQARFAEGNEVGSLARRLYDPKAKGVEVEVRTAGVAHALAISQDLLLTRRHPLFEAGFQGDGARAFADVLLPTRKAGLRAWHLVEVKSATSVKDHHRDDVAVQAFAARAAGVPLARLSLAYIDSGWTYKGHDDYAGLLAEEDLTVESLGRTEEVREWVAKAQRVARQAQPPSVTTGAQCQRPYECRFLDHCRASEPQAEHPVEWLRGKWSGPLADHIASNGILELRDLPDNLLTARQRRVKQATLTGRRHFDREGARGVLSPVRLPALFLDFETVSFAVPRWRGTRPYQQIPFQFSLHRWSRSGLLTDRSFIDLSGEDPSRRLAEQLITACGTAGPIFVYNAGFERACIQGLAERFKPLSPALNALDARLVDLLPVARDHFYHPSQQGSWSLKAVLPPLARQLRHTNLSGIQDGGMAMLAYREAIAHSTTAARKAEIERQLLEYCHLDTLGLVHIWAAFTGQPVPALS